MSETENNTTSAMRQKAQSAGGDNPVGINDGAASADQAQKGLNSPHVPRPPRPFSPRGPADKSAFYKHEWYLTKRAGILRERHNERAKAHKPRTAAQRLRIGKHISVGKKKSWKKMSATKRQNVLRVLEAGRSVQEAKYADRRPPWKIISGRLEGASLIELAAKNGTGRKPIRFVVRSVDLPEGKRYFCDRTLPFTRALGTELQKSLGYTKFEFAAASGVRKRRIVIWLTGSTKNLDPDEVAKCIGLRSREAAKLLDDKSVEALSSVDRYDRAAVLVTLFPRLKDEYKLSLGVIPAIRTFLKASDRNEEELGNFVIELAQAEKRGEVSGKKFRIFVRWLPQVMPWLLANQPRLKGPELTRLLVMDLLAFTCSCPNLSRRIIQNAVSDSAHLEPRRVREIRRLLNPRVEPLAIESQATLGGVTPRKKGGRPRGKKTEDTDRRMWLAAALFKLGHSEYSMSSYLYPNAKRISGERNTDSLVRRNREEIEKRTTDLTENQAQEIVEKTIFSPV